MKMASIRTTFTIEEDLLQRAKKFEVNVSAAARDGVAEAVRQAMIANDIAAYQRTPEMVDPFWIEAQAWTSS